MFLKKGLVNQKTILLLIGLVLPLLGLLFHGYLGFRARHEQVSEEKVMTALKSRITDVARQSFGVDEEIQIKLMEQFAAGLQEIELANMEKVAGEDLSPEAANLIYLSLLKRHKVKSAARIIAKSMLKHSKNINENLSYGLLSNSNSFWEKKKIFFS